MSTVILSCTSLADYVRAAQQKMGTDYPVVTIDKSHHREPEQMKALVAKMIDDFAPEVDTVLVATGFCGGLWDHVTAARRLVIPRVDDCVSTVLHMDDEYHPNLKEPGHLYMFEDDPDSFCVDRMMKDYTADADFRGWSEEDLFRMFFSGYRNLDIIDTGVNDCYSEEYVMKAQENADQFGAELGYVVGSNLLMEKLVSGRWDEQFIVAEPGKLIRHGDFF